MPMDIENEIVYEKIEVRFSKTIELITAIHVLVDSKHHKYIQDWINNAYSNLSQESKEMLNLLSSVRWNGLEIVEFVLKEKEFDNVDELLKRIESYSDMDFIYIFLGEEVSKENIEKVRKNRSEINNLLDDMGLVIKDSIKGIKKLLYNTQEFKKGILSLIKELDNDDFSLLLEKNKELYESCIKETEAKLLEKTAMDLTKEIMDKSPVRVYDFKEYYFVSSYFISPHRVRFFDHNTQIVIYDVRRKKMTENEIGDSISETLKIVSDRTRLDILRMLIAGASYGKLIAERLNLTTSTISHHLELLKTVKLVSEQRVKNTKYFSANVEVIERVLEEMKNYLFHNTGQNDVKEE